MNLIVWLVVVSLIVADVGAYIYMTLHLKKIERFESDLYRDIYEQLKKIEQISRIQNNLNSKFIEFEFEIYRVMSENCMKLDELERKYKELYHDNDDVK